jgi:hypothetical protein
VLKNSDLSKKNINKMNNNIFKTISF